MKIWKGQTRMSEQEDLETEVEPIQGLEISSPPEAWSPGQLLFYGPESRTVLLLGDIEPASSASLISQLLELNALDNSEPIYLHINSPGGSGVDGFVIYDMIRSLEAPVVGVVMGSCMSAALTVLSGCDFRISTENSMFFYHQAIVDGGGLTSGEDVNSLASHYRGIQKKYDTILRKRAGLSKKDWAKHFRGKTSKHLSAEQALEFGFIDRILEPAPKTFNWEVEV